MTSGLFVDEAVQTPDIDWWPAVDIFECPNEYVMVLSVPGVAAEAIEVMQSGRSLTVSGSREIELPAGASAHLLESPRGRFRRALRFPANADLAQARTVLEDGELRLHVPKVEPRAVRITVHEPPGR